MEKLILIKYGELTTKKENRKMFIDLLAKNIKNILKDYQIKIHKDRVRMYIECNQDVIDEVVEKLKKVFGIHGIVICHKVNTNIEDIKSKTLEVVSKIEYKDFPIKSMDFNIVMGDYILDNTNLKVDVHNPDTLINIEIRDI